MQIIKNGSSREIIKRRDAYIRDWQAKKNQYDTEVREYNTIKDNYIDFIKKEVIDTIGYTLLEPFGNDLTVSVAPSSTRFHDTWDNHGEYKITISYSPSKHERKEYYYNTRHFKGVPFTVNVFIDELNNSTRDRELVSAPVMNNISSIDPEDYDMLLHEISLFKKLDTIDWIDILRRAKDGPKREDYVKSAPPGYKDTSLFESELMDSYIEKTLNNDRWLLVNVARPASFNPDAYDVNEPDVHDLGWMQLIRSSRAYYYFHWIRDNTRYVRDRGYVPRGVLGDFYQSAVSGALTQTHKVKEAYFSLPAYTSYKPLYLTSFELYADDAESEDEA